METIIIRFIAESDPVSFAIRQQTWSEFSHVEFCLDDGTFLGAHAVGGVQIRAANYCTPSKEERYAIPVSAEQKVAILGAAHSQIGKPYDFALIAGDLLHRDWRCMDHWDCSEGLTWCFEQGQKPLLHAGYHINRITPRDVYLSVWLGGNKLASW